MKSTDNNTYNSIMNYIYLNKDSISNEEIRFLLRYANSIYDQKIENSSIVSVDLLLNDIKKLNAFLKAGEKTSLNFERLDKEMGLLSRILNGEDLVDVSFDLDKLYINSGLPAREKSVLVQSLKKRNKNEFRSKKNYK